MKIKIKRSNKFQTQNLCTLIFEGITQGELLAIMNSLENRSEKSAICVDLCNFVNREIRQSWPEVLMFQIHDKSVRMAKE